MDTNPIEAKITIPVVVDLAAMLAPGYAQTMPDGEWEMVDRGDPMGWVNQQVVKALVEHLVNQDLVKAVNDLRAQVIIGIVQTKVQQALEEPITVTDAFGSRRTETTLNELVMTEVKKQLTHSASQRGYDHKPSALDAAVKEHIDRALAAELKAEIDKAKDELRELAKQKAAEVLAQTITRMAGI